MYTVYLSVLTDGKVGWWTEIRKIRAVSVRELKVALEKGKVYQFAITSSNELGENKRKQISGQSRQREVCSNESYFPLSTVYPFLCLVFKDFRVINIEVFTGELFAYKNPNQ